MEPESTVRERAPRAGVREDYTASLEAKVPHTDPPWASILTHHGAGRAGAYQIVRGQVRDDVSEEDMLKVVAWADQVHTHKHGADTHLVALRRDAPAPRTRVALHLGLFLAACASTVVAGGFLAGTDVLDTVSRQIGGQWFPVPTGVRGSALAAGLPFAIAFIGVLLGHELGHYFAARRHRIPVSLPYFLPCPPYISLVGTLGAFIRLHGPMVRRSVLFDIGVAGPVASFLLSLPLLLVGLGLSETIATSDAGLRPFLVHFLDVPVEIGSNVVLHAATLIAVPGFESGNTVLLHPLAFAGWLGIFVTALNLVPLGQLDGGHILYALAGPRQRAFALAFVLLMLPLGFVWWGWWLWGVVALVVGRGRLAHPPVLMEEVPLERGRRILGWATIAIFFLSFSPAPLQL
ncbi:MAG: site-2 protease family protein [Gemmatimonadetes bacterium]|nr:site-2 protease family protein [Gemmatimonadota bacterium]MCY3611078.1 site-2 protease family protein [Gemmatimonadota bacterium]